MNIQKKIHAQWAALAKASVGQRPPERAEEHCSGVYNFHRALLGHNDSTVMRAQKWTITFVK